MDYHGFSACLRDRFRRTEIALYGTELFGWCAAGLRYDYRRYNRRYIELQCVPDPRVRMRLQVRVWSVSISSSIMGMRDVEPE